MVEVNMNHFDAQAHVHIQNKFENSVHCVFTVLKANKNRQTSCVDKKNLFCHQSKNNPLLSNLLP